MKRLRSLFRGNEPEDPDAGIDPSVRALFETGGLAAFERQLRFAEVVGDRDWVLSRPWRAALLRSETSAGLGC